MPALLLDDAFKTATPLTNSMINETLWQFAPRPTQWHFTR